MKKNMMKRAIESYCKELYEKYNVIQEIDFNKDIDVEKSDRYMVDEESGHLEFLFKEVDRIKSEDYNTVLGKLEVDDIGITLIPILNNTLIDTNKRSIALIKKNLIKDNDIIYIDFEMTKNCIFHIMLNNFFNYELFEKLKKNPQIHGTEVFRSDKRVCYMNSFGFMPNSLKIGKRIGLEFESSTTELIRYKNNRIKYLININRGYIKLENKKYKILDTDFIKKEGNYISLSNFASSCEKSNQYTSIREFVCGNESGYVYLQPIRIYEMKIQVSMSYKGDVEIQYYCSCENEWISIKNGQIINCKELLCIRAKMKSGDRIYNLFLTKEK